MNDGRRSDWKTKARRRAGQVWLPEASLRGTAFYGTVPLTCFFFFFFPVAIDLI